MYALRLVGSDVCWCVGLRRARLRALGLRFRGGLKLDGFTQSYLRGAAGGNVLVAWSVILLTVVAAR